MTSDVRHQVVLVRHGETAWSRSGQHTGRSDIPLTEQGHRDAHALAARLVDRQFAIVLSSPLSCALDTCREAGYGDRVEVTDDLREWDYGDYEGRTTVDVRRDRPGWSLWNDGVPGGETADEVAARADRVIEVARRALGTGDVALFAHGHILRVLAARWLGLPGVDGRLFALFPATLSILGYEREVPVIVEWNNHL